MTPKSIAVVVCVLMLSLPGLAHAKAWTQPAGDGYAKVWLRGLVGESAFLADGSVEPAQSYRDLSLRHYVEYGLAERWTVMSFGTPVGWASYEEATTTYVGPMGLGLRRGLLDGPVQLAVEAHYGYAPDVGETNLGASDTAVVYVPTVATHFAGGELQAGYGGAWGWTTASAGARWHSRDGLDPTIMASAQVGYWVVDGLAVSAQLGLYEPLGDVEVTNVAGTGQTRYLGFELGASWWITDHLGVAANLGGAAYAASNAAAPSLSLGVETKF
jgi:hypothetical protein